MKIPLDRIIVSKGNPRQTFDEEKLRELGESIKTDGLLEPIIVRPRDNNYELIVGERRVRASALVGLVEIEADIRELSDLQCDVFRLAENIHRVDLSDAEKGDQVYRLWGLYEEEFESIKSVAERLGTPYGTVLSWTQQSKRLSPKLKSSSILELTDEHKRYLVKYSHAIQDSLATVVVRNGLPSTKIREFCREYDKDPQQDLDILSKKIMSIDLVLVPSSSLTEEQKKILTEKKIPKKSQKGQPKKRMNREGVSPYKVKGMSAHSQKIIFSSGHDDWSTPPDKYKELDDEFHFNFDPCPLTPDFDGLMIDWKERNFINPPYSNIIGFLKKGRQELDNSHANLLVYLIPVRTDTNWFHTYVYPYFKKKQCEIRFIKGRVKFSNGTGSKHSAPFPSMVVVFDRRQK